jgi:phosphohistidine phosphatase
MNDAVARTLIVLRHAKSDWSTGDEDHARPLNKRGKRDAPRVGEELARRGLRPERVLTSDARRARDTYKRMRTHFPDASVETVPSLYLAGLDAVRACLAPLPSDVRVVMVVGHNPGWEDMVSELTGVPTVLTTANAAVLTRDAATWWEAMDGAGGWSLAALVRPRDLG